MKKIGLLLLMLCMCGCGTQTIDEHQEDLVQKVDYITQATSEVAWAYDVSDINLVKENVPIFLHLEVKEIEPSTLDYSSNPMTPIKIEVLDVLKGKIEDIDYIYQEVGEVTVQQILESYPQEKIKQLKLDQANPQEKRYFAMNDGYQLEEGENYIVGVHLDEANNIYVVDLCGYSIFKRDKDTGTFKNVLIDTILKLEDFK